MQNDVTEFVGGNDLFLFLREKTAYHNINGLAAHETVKTDLIVARKMAEKSNCSYIFGESSREIFCREYKNGFQQFSVIISSLFEFALKDLFVIRNTHSGVISANFVLPMAFRIENDNIGAKGDFAVSLTEPILVDEEKKIC